MNPLPIGEDASIRAKEFLHTTPYPYEFEVQSKSDVDDNYDQQHHNNQQPVHVSIPDERFQRKFCGVERSYSETRR